MIAVLKRIRACEQRKYMWDCMIRGFSVFAIFCAFFAFDTWVDVKHGVPPPSAGVLEGIGPVTEVALFLCASALSVGFACFLILQRNRTLDRSSAAIDWRLSRWRAAAAAVLAVGLALWLHHALSFKASLSRRDFLEAFDLLAFEFLCLGGLFVFLMPFCYVRASAVVDGRVPSEESNREEKSISGTG